MNAPRRINWLAILIWAAGLASGTVSILALVSWSLKGLAIAAVATLAPLAILLLLIWACDEESN